MNKGSEPSRKEGIEEEPGESRESRVRLVSSVTEPAGRLVGVPRRWIPTVAPTVRLVAPVV